MSTRRFWWVNQGQTFREESEGGYLWSPKRNKDGKTIYCYECMREIAPGDLIFSYADTKIRAVSIASCFCIDSTKPEEFGKAGSHWDQSGWRVNAKYEFLDNPLHPKIHIEKHHPLMREKWAPLSLDGSGLQRYLVEIDPPLVISHSTWGHEA